MRTGEAAAAAAAADKRGCGTVRKIVNEVELMRQSHILIESGQKFRNLPNHQDTIRGGGEGDRRHTTRGQGEISGFSGSALTMR